MTKRPAATASPREVLLSLLKAQGGDWVSGQLLAERTAMTRSAVWKQVEVLREEGYGIEALTHRGYRLLDIPDKLLPYEIRAGLGTRTLGRREIRYAETTASTNQTAKEMAAGGAPEGTLVVAEGQTRGRGRLERGWFSPPAGGLYASLILRPALPPVEAHHLVLLAAVAVAEALLGATGLKVSVKWPNDLMAGGRKIAGILTEAATQMDAVDYVVIGLGLNVNIPPERFPEELRPAATSLLAQTGRVTSRALLMRRILESLEASYDAFREGGFAPIRTRWMSLMDMEGARVSIRTMAGRYTGEVSDFDPDGFLILRDETGTERRFCSGDVTLLKGGER
jgi:BirA family transcriptional regulator, biotin operon repressor / biotin---[acetyl-CoA-carboxylase] ligase